MDNARGCALEHHDVAAYISLIALAEFMEAQLVPATRRYLELAAPGGTAKV
jgi:hypothetical protein